MLFIYFQWVRRELLARYSGSLLGLAWLILQPTLQLGIFVLLFHQFIGLRWGVSGRQDVLVYALHVFIGLAVFNFIADVIQRSPNAIVSQPHLVNKIKFPLPLLPAALVGASAVSFFIMILIATAAAIALHGADNVAPLTITGIALVLIAYALGCAWFLAALGVFVRDTSHIVGHVTSVLLFLSPVFYPADVIPPSWRWLIDWNPIAWGVESLRQAFTLKQAIDGANAIAHAGAALGFAFLAYSWFMRLRKGFADVL
ncbi:ABC transporter permease [Tepidimonas charontis]|uniref:Transport permease protein n=1 Tax=Tepidimonas charontis TaxID=2267262 RepID=A0A554XCC9_9BURK|nr:ABC transporter permease [Tepidimonas charontis]TSE33466.1 Teichoic acid translocation permease protein TagG [Tepidimonas charontis]